MKNESQSEDTTDGSLVDHLVELRDRLIACLWVVVILTFVSFHYAEYIMNILREPIRPYLPTGGLIYTGPIDKFMSHVKIAVVSGILFSCPWWLYQVWKFVAPGLYQREKKYAVSFIFVGTFLFLSGALFAYEVVLKMAFKFLMTFGGDADKPMIAIDSYLSFVSQIVLLFGLSFELPLVLSLLVMMRIISRKFLIEKRRYAVMTIAVISAIVTPPDLLSMVLMLVPMWFLYELSIVAAYFIEKARKEETAEVESR
jgi:sec-independent protein translocase protein TatC